MEWIIKNIDGIMAVITSIISISAAVAMVWKETDSSFLNKLRSVINLLALNIGKAKNAE